MWPWRGDRNCTVPELLVRADDTRPRPSAQLTHTARSGGVKLEAARTLAHGAARPQHAAAAHAAALVRILLGAVLLCASQQNTASTPSRDGLGSRLVPSLHSPRGGFPSRRGLASQKELLSLCDVGHWDPGRGSQWSAWSVHLSSCPQFPLGQPFPGRLTSCAWWARAALGTPTAALATATILKGEGGPSQGSRTHAVLSALCPAHVPLLRGTLCGRGPVREKPKARTTHLRPKASHSRAAWSPCR